MDGRSGCMGVLGGGILIGAGLYAALLVRLVVSERIDVVRVLSRRE
jgi:hypothetical protein